MTVSVMQGLDSNRQNFPKYVHVKELENDPGVYAMLVSSGSETSVDSGDVAVVGGGGSYGSWVELIEIEPTSATSDTLKWHSSKLWGEGIGSLGSGKKAQIRIYGKVDGNYPSLPHDIQEFEVDNGMEFVIDNIGNTEGVKIEIRHDDTGSKTFRIQGTKTVYY